MSSFESATDTDTDTSKHKHSDSEEVESILEYFPPMGIYETLYRFQAATGSYMGSSPHHRPWAQGYPLTCPLPNGPSIPTTVSFEYSDLKYPSATGEKPLLTAIKNYYNHFYNANIDTDNICIFAGGKPAIFTALSYLKSGHTVLVQETEYPVYFDALELLNKDYRIVQSNVENNFRPSVDTYRRTLEASGGESGAKKTRAFVLKSNPNNPTGVMTGGEDLRSLVDFCSEAGNGGIIDEAYEFFHENPESALKYIADINKTNIFVISAATKGLQAPGLRLGWIVASKKNVELFRNFSSVAMGGVSRLSQIAATNLLDIDRCVQARGAIAAFYGSQRHRYGAVLQELGLTVYTGDGGFYHWCKLPGKMTCVEFNEKLFKYEAAILPGTLCDMFRRGEEGPHGNFIRFSFGPLPLEFFDRDCEILRSALSD